MDISDFDFVGILLKKKYIIYKWKYERIKTNFLNLNLRHSLLN